MKIAFINNIIYFLLVNLITLVFIFCIVWIHTLDGIPFWAFLMMYGCTLVYIYGTLQISKMFLTHIHINDQTISWIYRKKRIKEVDWDEINSLKIGVRWGDRVILINYENDDSQEVYFYVNRNKLDKLKKICPKKELLDQLLKIKL